MSTQALPRISTEQHQYVPIPTLIIVTFYRRSSSCENHRRICVQDNECRQVLHTMIAMVGGELNWPSITQELTNSKNCKALAALLPWFCSTAVRPLQCCCGDFAVKQGANQQSVKQAAYATSHKQKRDIPRWHTPLLLLETMYYLIYRS